MMAQRDPEIKFPKLVCIWESLEELKKYRCHQK
jgi:hypothetical protein